MDSPAPLTFSGGILPLTLLVGMAVILPALLAGPTLSQGRLTLAMLVTAALVWMAGAGLMAGAYWQANGRLAAGVWSYLQSSSVMSLLYGPVLALIWLIRAQGVERRRGLLMRDQGGRG
jgi:hypothetical protein